MLKLGKIVGSPLYNLLRTALNAQPQLAPQYAGAIKSFLSQPQALQNPAIIDQAHRVIKMLESMKPKHEPSSTALPGCLRTYLTHHQQQKPSQYLQEEGSTSYTLSSQYRRPKPAG